MTVAPCHGPVPCTVCGKPAAFAGTDLPQPPYRKGQVLWWCEACARILASVPSEVPPLQRERAEILSEAIALALAAYGRPEG